MNKKKEKNSIPNPYLLSSFCLLNPLITHAGPPGYSGGGGVYLPSFIETGISVGIVSLGGLLVILGVNKFNLVR